VPGVDRIMFFDTTEIQDQWLQREAKKLGEDEKRRYSHFDPVVKLDDKRKSFIFSPENVSVHSFFPLIKWMKEERRRKLKEKSGLREIDIKSRPIHYAAHIDSLIYSWYGYQLNYFYDRLLLKEGLSEVVLAYRKLEKSTPEFVKEVINFIRKKGECTALCFDVSSFFDTIQHNVLKKNWISVLSVAQTDAKVLPEDHFRIFEKVTDYQYVEKETLEGFFPNGRIPSRNGKYLPDRSLIDFVKNKQRELKSANGIKLFLKNTCPLGIPQGLPISGVLANISMLDFDRQMQQLAKRCKGLYRRYSDDILLIVQSDAAEVAEKEVKDSLHAIGLESNDKKKDIKNFKFDKFGILRCENSRGKQSHLQYLGLEFDGSSVYLRSQSVARFYRRLKDSIEKSIWRLQKNGGKIFRYRNLYRKYTALSKNPDDRNFVTYSINAHKTLGSLSKIDKQINQIAIIKMIKREVKQRMS
jgi:hypothetical protein